jgi:hypothetical protein
MSYLFTQQQLYELVWSHDGAGEDAGPSPVLDSRKRAGVAIFPSRRAATGQDLTPASVSRIGKHCLAKIAGSSPVSTMYEMGVRILGGVQNSFRLVSYTPLDIVRNRSVSDMDRSRPRYRMVRRQKGGGFSSCPGREHIRCAPSETA